MKSTQGEPSVVFQLKGRLPEACFDFQRRRREDSGWLDHHFQARDNMGSLELLTALRHEHRVQSLLEIVMAMQSVGGIF